MKKIKFPLKMADDKQVRTLEELRENFDLAAVLGYYDDGRLTEWLTDRYYENEAEQVKSLNPKSPNFKQQLCEVLGAAYSADETMSLEEIAARNERLAKLKQFTAEDTILAAIDRVAFSQEELADLLDEDVKEIYLCGDKFSIPGSVRGVTYIGVNSPQVDAPSDFADKGIFLNDVLVGNERLKFFNVKPAKFSGLEVRQLSDIGGMIFAITADGRLWRWGNVRGDRKNKPQKLLKDVKSAKFSERQIVFLKTDNTLWITHDINCTHITNALDKAENIDGIDGFIDINKITKNGVIWERQNRRSIYDSVFIFSKNKNTVKKASDNLFSHGSSELSLSGYILFADGTSSMGFQNVLDIQEFYNRESDCREHYIIQNDGSIWWDGIKNRDYTRHVTVKVFHKSDIICINTNLVVKKDGTLWNTYGTYDNPKIGDKLMDNVAHAICINGGKPGEDNHSILAIKKDGTLWACGNNQYGQLGIGDVEIGNEFGNVPPTQIHFE
ncbi:MAG: hypothetical protein FWG64_00565 [Firmicutes bacterium]|nr:hypothetical protein [Bacillota bacterium]